MLTSAIVAFACNIPQGRARRDLGGSNGDGLAWPPYYPVPGDSSFSPTPRSDGGAFKPPLVNRDAEVASCQFFQPMCQSCGNPVTLAITGSGPIASVAYFADGTFELGRSSDYGSGFSITYAFGQPGLRQLSASAYNATGQVITNCNRSITVVAESNASPTQPTTGCGEYASAQKFTCSKDGNARGKCVSNVATVEQCPRGCLRKSSGDDVCMGTIDSWSCSGSIGANKAQNGDYYVTSFGCWVDANGTSHGDSGDNCIGACDSQAKSSGLCSSSSSGKACEEKINWFTAGSTRFGCMTRLRITNPKNQKAVIAVVLDAGPACWVEQSAGKAVMDVSSRVTEYLFGGSQGYADKSLVHVVEVDKSTPLGPVK